MESRLWGPRITRIARISEKGPANGANLRECQKELNIQQPAKIPTTRFAGGTETRRRGHENRARRIRRIPILATLSKGEGGGPRPLLFLPNLRRVNLWLLAPGKQTLIHTTSSPCFRVFVVKFLLLGCGYAALGSSWCGLRQS